MAVAMVNLGGIGHTSALYTNQDLNTDRIKYFGDKMKTARILVNTPTTHGGIGDLYNFAMAPSRITSYNVCYTKLLRINVPIGLLSLFMGLRFLPANQGQPGQRFDKLSGVLNALIV